MSDIRNLDYDAVADLRSDLIAMADVLSDAVSECASGPVTGRDVTAAADLRQVECALLGAQAVVVSDPCPDCEYVTLDRLAYWRHREACGAPLLAHHSSAETLGGTGQADPAVPLPARSCGPGATPSPVASGLPFDGPDTA